MPDTSHYLWLFFQFSGRASRAAYFLAAMLLAVAQALPLYRFTLVPEDSGAAQGWALIFGIVLIASLWSNMALAAKRLHDLGRPGIMALLLFVPVVSIIAFLALCLMPGEPGPNKYGARTNAPG